MYFAGIDAHAQYLQVAVLDKVGAVVAEGRVESKEPEAIARFLAPYRPLRVVVETCAFWPWIRDQLESEQVEFYLAHARELRAIASRPQKNDAVDASLLARMLRADLIPRAQARASTALETLRLVRHYAWLTRYRTMFANRIHGQLFQNGIHLGREVLLTRAGREKLTTLQSRLAPEQQRLIRTHYVMIVRVNEMLRGLRKRIRRAARESARASLLQSIPGIGPYWGLLLSAELDPIERFRSADHLVSYAGLAPVTRASGGHVRHGPVPAAANRWVRGAFVAAVMSHVRHAPTSRLTRFYESQKTRIGWKKARVATARKLARITYSILRSQRPWQG